MTPPGIAALAGPHKHELLLVYTLLQLTVIVLAGRIGGAVARRYGQSAAVGENNSRHGAPEFPGSGAARLPPPASASRQPGLDLQRRHRRAVQVSLPLIAAH
jgi:hypothetical protein